MDRFNLVRAGIGTVGRRPISDYFVGFYTTAQVALREIVASRSIDDLLEKRAEFDAELLKHCAPEVQKLGIKLTSLKVKDIMFPGEWKHVFAEVVRARQEGQAALERARGETAALRNLANAAKLMQDNPALLNLRTIQALGQSTGNTVILDLSGRAAQTSAKVQAADKPQPD